MASQSKKNIKREIPRSLGGLVFFLLQEAWRKKKWILIPLWILLISAALILILAGNSSILPAIYIIGF